MPIVVDATYEDGVLKPQTPLPLKEHERVRATLEVYRADQPRWRPLIEFADAELIDQAALDSELDF
jgi:predicted DNA-binding antitoxin AbrB/MazE fold protein